MASSEGTVALNNYLQSSGQLDLLVSSEVSTGPSHAPQWKVTYKLGDRVIGEGEGPNKATARDFAANRALTLLRSEEA